MLIDKVKTAIRVKTDKFDEDEVNPLIAAAKKDMERVGIVYDETDPLCDQAVVLYCKGHFGFIDNADRYIKAYEDLRDSMSLSDDYISGGEDSV